MVKCGLFLCPAQGRLPVGVLVSAYSTEDHTFRRLLREAHNAGRSAKRVSPHVPTALITQDLSLAERGAFDFAVPVRPDLLVRGAAREAGCALCQHRTNIDHTALSDSAAAKRVTSHHTRPSQTSRSGSPGFIIMLRRLSTSLSP